MVLTQGQRSKRCSIVSLWLCQIGQVGVGDDRLLNRTTIVAKALCNVFHIKWWIFGGTSNFQVIFHNLPGIDWEEERWWSLEERELVCTQWYPNLTKYLPFLFAAQTNLSLLQGSSIWVSLIAFHSTTERKWWRKLISYSRVTGKMKELTSSVSSHRYLAGWSKMSRWKAWDPSINPDPNILPVHNLPKGPLQ